MKLASTSIAVLLLAAAPVAHADGVEVARELAATLTSDHDAPLVVPDVVTFEPGRLRVYSKSREKLQALAENWQKHAHWGAITVDGHAGPLAQQRAELIRTYLVRYGVPADRVVAHAAPRAPLEPSVDLSIEVCGNASACGRTSAEQFGGIVSFQ